MKLFLSIIIFFLFQSIDLAYAGSIANGDWTSSACGEKPAKPDMDISAPQSYNHSVVISKEWQQRSNTYFDCVSKEANKDLSIIADKVKREQADYRKTSDAIAATLDAGKAQLEKQQ